VEIDGKEREISVGDVRVIAAGPDVINHTSSTVDPIPTLRFSGLPEDLALFQQQLPPQGDGSKTSMVWRNGAGKAVGALGVASAFAMAGMIGLGKLRERKERVAQAALAEQEDATAEADDDARAEEGQENV
jgi:hypothetical protein